MVKIRKPEGVISEYRHIVSGGRRMRLLIVRPAGMETGQLAPGVLWIHGGGYISGMPELVYGSRAIDLVTRCGAIVAAPDYTLSVKAPFPAALRDCHRALLYVKEHAAELGIRSDQIMVGGESAGGGLAAALCMYAADHRTVNIAFQMPLYPMLDCYDTESSRDNHAKVWNTAKNHAAWDVYLRGMRHKRIPCYASPALRRNYRGLPPCYTFVGDLEPFLDETLAYVRNLKRAGVEARVDVYKGFYHAYDMMCPETEEAKRAADVFVQRFSEACSRYRAPQNYFGNRQGSRK